MKNLWLFFTLALGVMACEPAAERGPAGTAAQTEYGNPAAEGFRAEASDPEAIAIADSVMQAMGGRQAWDRTRFLTWNFFGRRTLLWDKQTGDVRIDIPADSSTLIVNINDNTGKAFKAGEELTDDAALQQALQQARSIWINDAYWVFMPFKLKDSGVKLEHLGADTTQSGQAADLLQLTFEEVGDTPQNKYQVWVSKDDKLVRQWAYFSEAADEAPKFVLPWDNYQVYGDLLLSGDRGERQITDIAVLQEAPEGAFTQP